MTRATSRPTPQPTLGPLARKAAATPINGDDPQLRRLLILLAAYADAGEKSPSVKELARRVQCPAGHIDTMLKALIAQRLLYVQWRSERGTNRNIYMLAFIVNSGRGDT